jgi:hypothetical protein
MSRPEAAAIAALNGDYIKPAFLCFLDIVGDPLRVTTWDADLTFENTGDPDLDGHTFRALTPELVDISEVKFAEGGGETVTARLSGLILPNNDLLNILNVEANWRGRVARLWQAIYNANDVRQGAFWNYYTGRMVGMPIAGSPDNQYVEMTIETYLASLSGASNRTYLDQAEFDPQDLSADAAVAIANGLSGALLNNGGGRTAIPSYGINKALNG